MPKKRGGGGLGQFANLREGARQKKRELCFWRRWYPNTHYELGNNFNCDFNLLIPMSSLLISNKKKVLPCYWLIFFQQSDTCPFFTKGDLVYKNPLKRSVLKSQSQNPRNLDEKDLFFHTIHTKSTSNSRRNKK